MTHFFKKTIQSLPYNNLFRCSFLYFLSILLFPWARDFHLSLSLVYSIFAFFFVGVFQYLLSLSFFFLPN